MRADRAAPGFARRFDAFLRRSWPDLLGLAWIVLFVFLYVSPALKDGPTFGPADLGRGLSTLTSLVHAAPLHNSLNGDQIDQGVPWYLLDWQLVHHGQLPLWNSLSGNGMPQLLNFEAAPLALPSLVGYLFPADVGFLVTVAMKLLLMGTGTYALCRLLGARPLAASLGGTTAMLSGAFAGWLGWSITGPDALVGWVVAGVLWCLRRRGPAPVGLLALAVAFAVYGGFPESYVLLALALVLLLGVAGAVALARGARPGVRPLGRVGLGCALGLALSSPLWLPGIAVLRASARAGIKAATGIPLHMATLLLAQGYDGLPVHGSYFFGSWNYYETAAYVGVIAAVLAVVAVVTSWRRPFVAGLAAAAVGCAAVVYDLTASAPVQRLVTDVGLGTVSLQRALPLVGFAVAVLAAVGLERLVGTWHEPATRRALWAGCALLAVALGLLWWRVGNAGFAPGAARPYSAKPLPGRSVLEGLRRDSLWWPTGSLLAVALAGLLAEAAARRLRPRPPRHTRRTGRPSGTGPVIGAALLAVQSAFLLFAGVGINSYAGASFPATPATATVARVVGTGLLGMDDGLGACHPPALVPPACGVRAWRGIGFYPEMNLGYGIAELGIHDPTIPQAVFDGWPFAGTGRRIAYTNLFAPDIDTVALARRYGVTAVLVAPGLAVPAGMTPVASLVNHGVHLTLATVPGSGRFSVAGPGAALRASSHPGDARYEVEVRAPAGAVLTAHVTDVPGWRASAGGHPLVVRRAPGDQLSVRLPAGTTAVELTYAPARLLLGELLAAAALAGLAGWVAFAAVARRARAGGRAGDGRRRGRGSGAGRPGEPAPAGVAAGSLERWLTPPTSAPTPTRSTPSSSSTSAPSTPS